MTSQILHPQPPKFSKELSYQCPLVKTSNIPSHRAGPSQHRLSQQCAHGERNQPGKLGMAEVALGARAFNGKDQQCSLWG